MSTTDNNTYSPSVNIIRDRDTSLNYIVTQNAKRAFNQLVNDYQIGIRVFNLVGAYGIGKSSFLWALKKDLNGSSGYFGNKDFFSTEIKEFKFLEIIGQYESIQESFAEELNVKLKKNVGSKELIRKLDEFYSTLKDQKNGLVIFIDEFGKYLEFAAKNNPEKDLYFIQEIAEYISDRNKNIILIASLHQDFNGYSRNLSLSQQNEWDKVKGRLKEITFNEPVEQLLFLAAERTSQLNLKTELINIDSLFEIQKKSSLFPLKDYFNKGIAEKLLPFDLLSAATMTIALQRYGQNERSLFSFLESNDPLGIKALKYENTSYYNLTNVYDYLIHHYYSFLTTKLNPNLAQWAAIRSAIERVEGLMEKDQLDAIKLIKTIGLLNLFGAASGRITDDFLEGYCLHALNIENTINILKDLEKKKIVRYVKHAHKYILFQGTDLDIELAIDEAGNLVERVTSIVDRLADYFEFNYISAKAVHYERGTPRFFEFQLVETPISITPEGEVDGFIQLIFSEKLNADDIKEFSENCEEAILFAWYTETQDIQNTLYELSKINKVITEHREDKVAIKELQSISRHQTKLLNHYVLSGMYSGDKHVQWFFKGTKVNITSPKILNQKLSEICTEIYPSTPRFKNEMVNRTRLSSPINTARKSLIKNAVEKYDLLDLGYGETIFPPDKTIYLTLIKKIGLHTTVNGGYDFAFPKDKSFHELWLKGEEFLDSSKYNRRNVNDFIDLLLQKPFKLKMGFIEFWLPLFLFVKRNDFALFDKNAYIPDITASTLDIITKNPKDYYIKAFDIEGIKLDLFNKYRNLLEQTEKDRITNQGFIETIKPFLKFYREIPEYAKNTTRISKKALALRAAIAQAKDPEKSFFEEFPNALGYNIVQLQNDVGILEKFMTDLQSGIREIRTCYDGLIDRVEAFLSEEIVGGSLSFTEYKERLQQRFISIKIHLLKPEQKTFHQRLLSPLDDRKAWISSIIQSCVLKNPEQFTDEDEAKLYDKFLELFHELDNLCELSTKNIDNDTEDLIKVEITSFVEGLKKNFVRLPKSKSKQVELQEETLRKLLVEDKRVNIAVLTNLLQEELKK